MVDSRDKGKRAEYQIRDILREKTGLEWERVPGSGGFNQSHGLKGDIYLPASSGKISHYTIEVKHYKDDTITSNLIKDTVSTLEKWWEQTVREAGQMNAQPLLVFKKDRGSWVIALSPEDQNSHSLMEGNYIILGKDGYEIILGDFNIWLDSIKTEDLIK